MAGTVVIGTLSDGTNSTSATNCIQGSAKAWVNFNGTGTVAIRASYNVSSITDNGTGDYTVNFTNAMPDANYDVNFGTLSQGTSDCRFTALIKAASISSAPSLMSTTQVQIITGATHATGIFDAATVTVSIFR